MKSVRLGPGREFDLIRSVLAGKAGHHPALRLGPGDDAAVIALDHPVVLSTDLSIEGVHFRSGWMSPEEIGFRAATAALSDLAAMAARPIGVLASIAVDAGRSEVWVPELATGIRSAVEACTGVLLGGDLSSMPEGAPAVVDITAVGQTLEAVGRSTSRPGDEVWVTGELGWPAYAVSVWESGDTPIAEARARFTKPAVRWREAAWLQEHQAIHAMIDVSDGLVADARHIAAASQVAVGIQGHDLPVPASLVDATGLDAALRFAATGGEEYELLFTGPSGAIRPLAADFEEHFGVRLNRIGEVTSGSGVSIVGVDLDAAPAGHDHFNGHSS